MGKQLIFYCTRENRYSFNALLGAIETSSCLNPQKIAVVSNYRDLFAKIEKAIEKSLRPVVAFSFFTSQFWAVKKIVRDIRHKFADNVFLVAGGPHPTGEPQEVLNSGFDFVISGEGEETVKDLVSGMDFRDIKGGYFQDSIGKAKFTGKRKCIDINGYLPFSPEFGKFGPIEITRGCPFACSYCQTSFLFGTGIRHRSVEKIIEAVEIMARRGLKDTRFISPDAFSYGSMDGKTLNLKALEELLKNTRKVLKKEGKIFFGTFPSEARPEHVIPETLELTRRYADNRNLLIGAQSGSDEMLEKIKRGHTANDVYNAVRLAKKYGFTPLVDFIFGLPGETRKEAHANLKAINDFIKMGARIHTHFFMPLPQTPLKNAKPAPLSKTLETKLKRITGQGKAFGQWEQQKCGGI
ncbi:MAG: TIGR04013 family B12-binding domain/radical SAM domain-containing protein [Elusimicrobia bacterium]|nr:TIGR04013 family B12-binding domain/radical SAM domain-containing protein [Elusimicrobiota bacterium]